MTSLPERKHTRLPGYDYSTPGAYFVTICTRDKACLFWESGPHYPVGAAISRPPNAVPLPVPLSVQGTIVDRAIQNIPSFYPDVSVDRYVIMPNHIHLLVRIERREDDIQERRADNIRPYDLSTVIGQMKRWASARSGLPLWQRSYHDHIIRGDADYREIWEYIENNPARWREDCFFPAEG